MLAATLICRDEKIMLNSVSDDDDAAKKAAADVAVSDCRRFGSFFGGWNG